ncbi:MAG TPA: isochorismate synthase, partial [Actinomycetota bacterium]|nr:isochorismate synthase [Actinomycetota bacterium]
GEVATAGVAAEVRVPTGRDRVQRAADATGALLGQARVDDPEGTGLGPLAAGAVPFGEATPGRLSVPALVVRRGPDRALWAVATAAGRRPDPPDLRTRPRAGAGGDGAWPEVRAVRAPAGQDRAGFQAAVRAALDVIAGPRLGGGRLGGGLLGGGGLLDKVVLARELLVEAAGPFPRQAVLRRLRERAAGSFVYASGGFVGASPELLVARRGRTATSRPMAGTVPRGGAAGEEAGREAWLRASGKETAEHRLVVDMVAETLAKVADDIAVAPVEVVRLPTVAHLATRVSAELTAPVPSALELAGLLHPTPAVAGSPRDAALEVLAGLEPFDRGRYGGPVGWVDHRGDGEWAVALRCATLHRAGARLVAGAGIVAGSDPDAEWAETGYKLEAMLRVLTSS